MKKNLLIMHLKVSSKFYVLLCVCGDDLVFWHSLSYVQYDVCVSTTRLRRGVGNKIAEEIRMHEVLFKMK